VGIVPEEWETIRLGNICEINRGGSPRPIEQYLTTDSNGINWIKIGDAEVGGKYITSTKEKIKPTGEKKSRKVYSGDFLLSNSMSYGRPYILQIDGCIHDGWLVISKYQHRFILDYFYYTLCSTQVQKQYDVLSAGSGVQNLNKELVSQVTVMIPPLPEQQKIAEILTAQDAVIALLQKQIELLQKQKKAFLQKMFPKKGSKVPEIRFAGFTDAWEQRKLGELMEITSVKRIHQSDWTDSGVRFLRARDIVAVSKNEEVSEPLFISQEKYDEYSALSGKVKIGDLLVTGVGTIGVPMLINSEEPLYFKDGNIIWFKNENRIDGRFFYYSFNGSFIQNFITESSGIGTVGTYTIENGKKTPINLPVQKEEQEKIGEYFSKLDTLITLHQRKLELEQQKKKALMQLLLTGKVRCV
jgi:type I restriction enzyme S subunit